MKEKIAIQGIEGSFHHQVAHEYYGKKIELLKCNSFQQLAARVASGECSGGVMAIENSIAGSILPNYSLIEEYDLAIRGEHCISIDLNLLAQPGQELSKIKKVYSHPMALLQCKEFLRDYPDIKLVEDVDTAGAAKRIAENGKGNHAAIASKKAARMYKLEIMARGIHSLKTNFTRFLILHKEMAHHRVFSNKASFRFELENRQGSLAGILHILREFEMDLTKIQSLPIPQEPWKYAFFIDVTFQDAHKFHRVMEVLRFVTVGLKVFGMYEKSTT